MVSCLFIGFIVQNERLILFFLFLIDAFFIYNIFFTFVCWFFEFCVRVGTAKTLFGKFSHQTFCSFGPFLVAMFKVFERLFPLVCIVGVYVLAFEDSQTFAQTNIVKEGFEEILEHAFDVASETVIDKRVKYGIQHVVQVERVLQQLGQQIVDHSGL
jgi:hypothetical protein